MAHDYAVDAETHDKLVDALFIATSKLDAAERLIAEMRSALELAAKYVAKMDADGVDTVVPLRDEIQSALNIAKTRQAVQKTELVRSLRAEKCNQVMFNDGFEHRVDGETGRRKH